MEATSEEGDGNHNGASLNGGVAYFPQGDENLEVRLPLMTKEPGILKNAPHVEISPAAPWFMKRLLRPKRSDGEKGTRHPGSLDRNGEVVRIVENPLHSAGPESSPDTSTGTVKYMLSRRGGSRFSPLEKALAVLVIFLVVACVCILSVAVVKKAGPDVCLTSECVKTAASLLSAMDPTADPCDDFFQYACGTWNRQHVIPEDRSSISTFEVMSDKLQIVLKGLLEEPFNRRDNKGTRKAKLFYKSCMNMTQREQVGDLALKEVLKSLGGFPVTNSSWSPPHGMTVEKLVAIIRKDYNLPILIEQWVGPDDKNSNENIIQIDQMNLGLPSREYFLKNSSKYHVTAYQKYMSDVAFLLGADPERATVEMEKVVNFEILLANASLAEDARLDTGEIYQKVTLKDLQKEVPGFDWTEYLHTTLFVEVGEDEPIVTYAMPYLKRLAVVIRETPPEVIYNYAMWRLVMELMAMLPGPYQETRAEFRRTLLGITAHRVNWQNCVEWTNKKLGLAVGTMYIQEHFDQESKETALEMIHGLREAFDELLEENEWMDEETRKVAREKAFAMNERIGYPDMLEDPVKVEKEYEDFNVAPDEFLRNVFESLRFQSHRNLKELKKPVNKEKWSTDPAVVNAFYNVNQNDIVFPAGILQPLFYSQHFPKSLNYGGIGVVIGHEITHGFDDKGRQFDKNGNLKQWWNNATIQAFRNRTKCIIDQYSRYKLPEVGLFINGKMTQGENIADNGGLKQSFRAYKKWVERNGKESPLPGLDLNHEQLFFLNYAQIWCGSMRPEDAISKVRSSFHPPGPVRVKGPLSNSWDFARAYRCAPGSPMNPEHKCSIW